MKKIYLLLIATVTLGLAESNAQCFADFQFTTNNLTANFQDSSSYSPSTPVFFDWNFGDGNVGFGTNPSHTYSAAGTYNVCLTISDSTFFCFDTICKTIVVTSNQPQPCNLTYSYTTNPNNVVSFTSSITGGTAPYAYFWDFGDNSTSTLASPNHAYSTTGAYGVTLTATDANGTTCSYYDTVYVNFCNAYFTSSVNSNGVASFTNQSTPLNSGVNYSWTFGDGNSSSMMNPTNTYTVSNSYVVTLSIFDSLTNCSSSYSDTVSVQIGTPNNCSASYTIAKDSSLAFGVILYNTSSNFGSHTYSWNFGDGTTGSGRTPVHQYQSFGSYVVCLTISDSILNCTSTFCDTVGMDTLGNLKAGFGLSVQNPTITSIPSVEVNLDAISLYPNPAANQITLDLSSSLTPVSYTVMDITGKEVRAEQRSMSIEKVDLTGLGQGIYFMILNDGSNQVVKKFIKH